jgi:hypothetical protein
MAYGDFLLASVCWAARANAASPWPVGATHAGGCAVLYVPILDAVSSVAFGA